MHPFIGNDSVGAGTQMEDLEPDGQPREQVVVRLRRRLGRSGHDRDTTGPLGPYPERNQPPVGFR